MTQREEFEAWMRSDASPLNTEVPFNSEVAIAAWSAWQAAKAAQIPADIKLMAQRIAADKFEHCTRDPIFTVEKRRVISGIDTEYTENIGWFHDGEQVTGDAAADLDADYEKTGDVPVDYTRTGIHEEWQHVASYFTQEAAQAFAKDDSDYRINVDSAYRNHEWKAVRALLLSIAPAKE